MTLNKYMLVALGLGLVTSVHGGIKEYSKVVNGVRVVRIKTGGLFCPSTTTVCYYPTNQPGMLLPMNAANSAGVLGQVAGAAGQATSGALIRPSKTIVTQGASAETFSQANGGNGGAGGIGVGGNGGAGGNGGNPGGNNGNGGNPHFLP